jgi:hypothetical protein
MILREQGHNLIVISQKEHADLSGQFAAQWGNDDFDKLEPRLGMEQAAAHHDDGWENWDRNPVLDPKTKKPYDFYQLPTAQTLKIHEETIQHSKNLDLYARLMISMHRSGLCYERYGTERGWEVRTATRKEGLNPELKRFADDQEAWQSKAKKELYDSGNGLSLASESHIWANYKLIQVFDRLSLFMCWEKAEGKISPTPKNDAIDVELLLQRPSQSLLKVNPWPFGKHTFDVQLNTHVIENREYENSDDVAKELYFKTPSSTKVLSIKVERGP